jgi:hypothetical protein
VYGKAHPLVPVGVDVLTCRAERPAPPSPRVSREILLAGEAGNRRRIGFMPHPHMCECFRQRALWPLTYALGLIGNARQSRLHIYRLMFHLNLVGTKTLTLLAPSCMCVLCTCMNETERIKCSDSVYCHLYMCACACKCVFKSPHCVWELRRCWRAEQVIYIMYLEQRAEKHQTSYLLGEEGPRDMEVFACKRDFAMFPPCKRQSGNHQASPRKSNQHRNSTDR